MSVTTIRPIRQAELPYFVDTFEAIFPAIKRDGLTKKAAIDLFNQQWKATVNSARKSSSPTAWAVYNQRGSVAMRTESQIDTIFTYWKECRGTPSMMWPSKGTGNRHELLEYLTRNFDSIISKGMKRSALVNAIAKDIDVRYPDSMVQDAARDIGIVWRNGKACRKSDVVVTMPTYRVGTPIIEKAYEPTLENTVRELTQILQSALKDTSVLINKIANLEMVNRSVVDRLNQLEATQIRSNRLGSTAPEVEATVPTPIAEPVHTPLSEALNKFKFDTETNLPTSMPVPATVAVTPNSNQSFELTPVVPQPAMSGVHFNPITHDDSNDSHDTRPWYN